MNTDMNKEFIDAIKEALAPLVDVMQKSNDEAAKQREFLADTIDFLKVAIKGGNFDKGVSKDSTPTEASNSGRNIRQDVINTITKKQEFIYAQAFHRGFSFKKAQDALISGTNPKSLGPAFREAMEKSGPINKEKYEKTIKDIQSKREKGERVDNRNLLGLFSSYATADWNRLADDSPEKIKYFTMEHFLKNNVHVFFEKSGDIYNRVRNPSSIIKDFQRAVQKAWAKNGFGISMDNDKTKLVLDILTEKDIDSDVKLYMNSKVEQIGMVNTDDQKSEQHVEEVVEVIAESDEEEPESIVVEKPKKTTRKRGTGSKKTTKTKTKAKAKKGTAEDTEDGKSRESSPKPCGRRGRRTGRRKAQAVVDSDSESESDM